VRAVRWTVLAAGSTLVTLALLDCSRASPPSTSPGFDVYVPMPEDGRDATVADASTESGFGLGQVDRAGRPLVTVLLVPGATQDEYNAQPTFEANLPRTLQDGIASRIAELDTLVLPGTDASDPVDWPEGGALLPMVLGDTLMVDTSLPCTGVDGGFVASYLDLEREALLPGPAPGPAYTHTTCGGRTPTEDVTDKSLTLLVTGDRDGGPSVTQGVPGPTRAASTTFPYLAPPN
jgi:hypothetical protein